VNKNSKPYLTLPYEADVLPPRAEAFTGPNAHKIETYNNIVIASE